MNTIFCFISMLDCRLEIISWTPFSPLSYKHRMPEFWSKIYSKSNRSVVRKGIEANVHGAGTWSWMVYGDSFYFSSTQGAESWVCLFVFFLLVYLFYSLVCFSWFSSVQSLSRVRLFVTPWIAAHQASLSITNSRSSLRLTSIESVMPSNHLILCRPLLLLPPIRPSIRVFSNESTLRMRWPKHWSFSFSISPSKEHPGLISFRMDWLDLLAVQGTLKSLLQHHKHQFFSTQPSSQSNSHIHTWPQEKP